MSDVNSGTGRPDRDEARAAEECEPRRRTGRLVVGDDDLEGVGGQSLGGKANGAEERESTGSAPARSPSSPERRSRGSRPRTPDSGAASRASHAGKVAGSQLAAAPETPSASPPIAARTPRAATSASSIHGPGSTRGLLEGNVIGCLTAVYDSACFGKVEMPPLPFSQDYALWLDFLSGGGDAHGLDEVLAAYRGGRPPSPAPSSRPPAAPGRSSAARASPSPTPSGASATTPSRGSAAGFGAGEYPLVKADEFPLLHLPA